MRRTAVATLDEGAAAGRVARWHRALLVLAGLGGLLCLAALFGQSNRTRLAFAYLWGYAFVWTVVLGCLFFVALQHLTRSVWSVGIRRLAEAFCAPAGWLAVGFVPLAMLALRPGEVPLFPWADARYVAGDHLLEAKHAYLNVPFFLVRAALFFGAWAAFARFYVHRSLAMDRDADGRRALALRKWSAPFMLVFAATVTFAGVDWLMSLSPRWFSTIFGVYVFAGMVPASLAVLTLVTLALRRLDLLERDLVTDDHLYSLGALLFAFTCFWAYIAFSQYMLIWYANVPEESFYIFQRVTGRWAGVSVALALMRFAVPFLLLLSRSAKTNPRRLVIVSVLILVGQLLDLYWLVFPELHHEGPALGWQELGPPLLLTAVLGMLVLRFGRRHPLTALGDPLVSEARHFHL